MTTSSGRKHAGPGPAGDQPPVPEPTFAERARTLIYLGRVGSLSTLSRKRPGFPFGSVMPFGLDDHGRPIFLISIMAMHTRNLQPDARASLLATQEYSDMPRSNDCLTRPLLPDAGDETIFHLRHIGRIPGQFRAQRAFFQQRPPRTPGREDALSALERVKSEGMGNRMQQGRELCIPIFLR
jgi:hypothetical protein